MSDKTETPKCSPTLTECPRCKNDIAKCDGTFRGDKSETPRTDGFVLKHKRIGVRIPPEAIDFTSQLESELAEKAREVEELRVKLDDAEDASAKKAREYSETMAHTLDRAEKAEADAAALREEIHSLRVKIVDSIYGQPCPTPSQWERMQGLVAARKA